MRSPSPRACVAWGRGEVAGRSSARRLVGGGARAKRRQAEDGQHAGRLEQRFGIFLLRRDATPKNRSRPFARSGRYGISCAVILPALVRGAHPPNESRGLGRRREVGVAKGTPSKPTQLLQTNFGRSLRRSIYLLIDTNLAADEGNPTILEEPPPFPSCSFSR